MFELKNIESFYPENLRIFKKNLLREYLQYKILGIIFDSKYAPSLCFMGGTAARIIYGNTRFSEDLDFDNRGLNKHDFESMSQLIKKKLNLEGYVLEVKNTFKGAYHSYIRIFNILFDNKLSNYRQERLLIQIDIESQNFKYKPDRVMINKFDVFIQINGVPIDILLSQKLYAILNRKRAMGRDFHDVVYLVAKTTPNFDYLNQKSSIKNNFELKKTLSDKIEKLDFKILARDVEPFLFAPEDVKKVLLFPDFIKGWE
ncbi:MAG: nucleotidyl transferase AbiEii/AbiGii toxin family protein [Candidatus Omnitrophica bacterium]|nr:nucleotidyl transferase AbiEii/AbiGii toxin family protein [Candidatus Omnitrophota bacterium]